MNMAKEGDINYMTLTKGKLITRMLVKMLLFVTNKVFREIIVWLHVDLHILQLERDKPWFRLTRARENFAFQNKRSFS